MNEPYGPGPQDPRDRDGSYPARPHDYRAFDPQHVDTPRFEQRPYDPRPYEPLAHEGGFAYGNPPAPPASYGPPGQFIPAHLQVPHPYAPPMYQQPYMYPPQIPQQQMQQTVFVNGSNGKRVSHGLHLVLTLLTAGLWLPVWIILAIANS